MKFIAVAATMAALSAPAAAVVIDFEDRANGNQGTTVMVYPEATFTGTGDLFVNGAGVGKDLCTFGTLGCNGTMTVTFANAVSGLSFTSIGDNSASSLFITIALEVGGPVNLVRPLDGNTYVKDAHDLTAYSGITGLTLFSDDLAGLAYDDFSFTVDGGGTGGVPEPASWAMLIAGFGLMGGALRRRRTATVTA